MRLRDKSQETLFGIEADEFTIWKKEWKDMPEFIQHELKPFKEIVLRFETKGDVEAFAKLVNQNISLVTTKYLWYPEVNVAHFMDKRWKDKEPDAVAYRVDDTPNKCRNCVNYEKSKCQLDACIL
jgi:hypothetical protein